MAVDPARMGGAPEHTAAVEPVPTVDPARMGGAPEHTVVVHMVVVVVVDTLPPLIANP